MINIAIVGIGNCASALVQGIELYKKSPSETIGVLSIIKKYSIKDFNFVVGFDVNKNKVGKDLSKAIFIEPNCASKIFEPKSLSAPVIEGPLLDGLDSDIKLYVPVNKVKKPGNIKQELLKRKVDVVVILLPTGSQKAAERYAEQAIEAGCAVVNGMPALIANNNKIVKAAKENKVPIIGDDIKSQIGATIIHRALTHLFPLRDAVLDRTIQLDWGGDMDFCNLMSNGRYEKGKRQSKTEAVVSDLPNKKDVEVQVSAVDFIPFLKNQKEAYMRLEGRIFGNQPVRIDITMQVQDAFNSAGILTDCIRVAMIAKDRKLGGALDPACSFFNKKPPIQKPDVEAKKDLVEFLEDE